MENITIFMLIIKEKNAFSERANLLSKLHINHNKYHILFYSNDLHTFSIQNYKLAFLISLRLFFYK